MQFDMEIPATEFKENRIKILSSVALTVSVVDDQEQVKESFTTRPEETIYSITAQLAETDVVRVKLIPGSVVAFYPVVQAL